MNFGQVKSIWNSKKSSSVIGVETVGDLDEVVITTTHDVRIQAVTSGTCSANWMYRPESDAALKVPAIKHCSLQSMFSVRGKDKNVLVSWPCAENSMDNVKSRTLNLEVCRLFTNSSLGCHVLVLFVDGSFCIVDEHLSDVLDSGKFGAHGSVQWSEISLHGRTPILCIVSEGKEAGSYILQTYSLRSNENSRFHAILSCATTLKASKSTAKRAAFALHKNPMAISIVWSNGEWQKVYLDARRNAQKFEPRVQQLENHMSMSENAQKAKKKRRRGMTSHVAVSVGNSSAHLVLLHSNLLSGWNAEFGVQVQAEMELDNNPISMISTHTGDYCVILFKDSVQSVQIESKSSALLGVIGRSAITKPAMSIPVDITSGLDVLEQKKWDAAVNVSAEEDIVIKKLVSDRETASRGEFVAVFNTYIKKLSSSKRKDCGDKRVGLLLTHRFLMEIARYCVERPDLGLWDPLKHLIKTGLLSARRVPKLLPVIMEHEQISLVRECLNNLLDIPESMCVSVLRFLLSYASKKTEKKNTLKVLNESEQLICMILLRQRNELFLQNALQDLSVDEVGVLLSLLRKFYVIRREELKCSHLKLIPSMEVVFEWLCMLLDTHFQSIIIESSTKEYMAALLQDWNSKIADQIKTSSEIAELHGELGHIFTQDIGTDTPKEYSIDTLHF